MRGEGTAPNGPPPHWLPIGLRLPKKDAMPVYEWEPKWEPTCAVIERPWPTSGDAQAAEPPAWITQRGLTIHSKIAVGMAGFEPAASCSQSRRANQAALHPVLLTCDNSCRLSVRWSRWPIAWAVPRGPTAAPILSGALADAPNRQPELSSGYEVTDLRFGPRSSPGNLAG